MDYRGIETRLAAYAIQNDVSHHLESVAARYLNQVPGRGGIRTTLISTAETGRWRSDTPNMAEIDRQTGEIIEPEERHAGWMAGDS